MEKEISRLRKTLDEVIPRCSSVEELSPALHAKHIDFVRFVNDPDPAVIAEGWERPVSFSELGEGYDIAAIRARIDAAWRAYEEAQEASRGIMHIDSLRAIHEARQGIREDLRIRQAIDRED